MDTVIRKAKDYLKELEAGAPGRTQSAPLPTGDQISFSDVGGDEVRKTLCAVDLNTLTPIEAMNLLYQLQQKAKG